MPNPLNLNDTIGELSPELHAAMHLALPVPSPLTGDEHFMLTNGFAGGALFGMHFACQYPNLAIRMANGLFKYPGEPGPNKAADLLAAAIAEKIVGLSKNSPQKLEEIWAKLSSVDEGAPVTDKFWPLPK